MSLTLEYILHRSFKEDALRYLAEHPGDFEKVLKISLSDEPHACWRAAWLIKNCMEDNDPRIKKYLDEIVGILPGKEDGHQRELLKILHEMELNEKQESILYDHCVSLWESVSKIPSIRFMAFKMMVSIAQKYPELTHEIQMLTQPQYVNSLSPGIKRSLLKMVRKLE